MSDTTSDPHPAGDDDRPRRHVDDSPLIPERSADDSDAGWGDRSSDANDERLLRDKPPHW